MFRSFYVMEPHDELGSFLLMKFVMRYQSIKMLLFFEKSTDFVEGASDVKTRRLKYKKDLCKMYNENNNYHLQNS